MRYKHPLSQTGSYPLLAGSHVTLEAGTGLVHTAPAHGPEDYLLGVQHNLNLSCPVNEQGCYDGSVDVMEPSLQGLSVLGEGNSKIIQLLEGRGHILAKY